MGPNYCFRTKGAKGGQFDPGTLFHIKSGVCKKKSKIAHNFFMTKATDLKTIFLKSS